MTFDVEIVVRHSGEVIEETLYHDGPAPAEWAAPDVRAALTSMLLAVDRAAGGGRSTAASVSLRGLSWIVTPFDGGSAIAIEIPSGSVIAGPIDLDSERLTEAIRQAISAEASPEA